MSRATANGLLLLAGAIWGMGFIAQSTAMASIGPFLFVGLRFLIATLVTLPFAFIEASRSGTAVDRNGWIGFVWIGLALFAGIILQQIGLLTTTVTNSGFLTGLYVVFVPFLMVLALRIAPHPVIWPASAFAFAGLYLLSGGAIVSLRAGDLLTILAAGFWAVQVILIAKFGTQTGRPITLSACQFAICAALGLAGAALLEPISLTAVAAVLPEILYAGAIASGLAFTLQAIGQRHTSPALAAILLSTEALFAAFFGAWFLGDRIGSLGYAGGFLIFVAIVAVEALPALQRRKAAPSAERA
ncbi:DMT family transporter [Pararhizobium haloflavum]|uniref:DMT family transporter n=1 Tax=Pararhizobium haloflavum TaxID=2037914 RepID=UPI000C19E6B1|nr:DMT family transporter [Pararhizobium haloflavum]